jgi:hypothetical protein
MEVRDLTISRSIGALHYLYKGDLGRNENAAT